MKKALLLCCALLLMGTATLPAQVRFGVKAGLSFNDYTDLTKSESLQAAWDAQTSFHAGLVLSAITPIGFAFQPEILYARQGASLNANGHKDYASYEFDYLQIPLNLQWGVSIYNFRPFVQASPYLSYALRKSVDVGSLGIDLTNDDWDDVNRFDYGFGLGAGFDIWKLQFSAKYNWGFGKVMDMEDLTWDQAKENIKSTKNRSFQLSLAFLF